MVAPAPLEELLEKVQGIEIPTYDYEDAYNDILNAVTDYMNDAQDWEFEDVLYNTDERIISYDEAEDYAKQILDSDGLSRLYYFMGDCNFDADNLFWLNGYGNLTSLDASYIEDFKDDVIKAIEEAIVEESEG